MTFGSAPLYDRPTAFVLQGERAAFEFGLRYSHFPTIKETDDVYEVKYDALGIFAGLAF